MAVGAKHNNDFCSGGRTEHWHQTTSAATHYSFCKFTFLFAIIFCSLMHVPILHSRAVQVVVIQPVHLEISLCSYTCAFLVSNLGMNMLLEKL